MSCRPFLSVLIPAYDDSTGVKRILDLVYRELSWGLSLECIVSDDSRSSDVENMVLGHPISEFDSFRFIRNSPSLGATTNWNFLLDSSTGNFVLFMHHDEFPYEIRFFSRLVKLLKISYHSDVVILKSCVQTIIPNKFRSHVPLWVARLYFSLGRGSIMRRNFIGSPSNVCVRRACLKKFDTRLKWLVDVDWYYRVFANPDVKVSFSNLRVLSVFNSKSISASISSETTKLRDSELKIITFASGKEASFQRRWGGQIFGCAEALIWPVVRLLSIPLSTVMGFYVHREIIDNNESTNLD